ncbi:hypothetical protein JXA80_12490, partial [bacterium]|nr:hypothetical protein [candidate division CSSED10-310 bacterium]
ASSWDPVSAASHRHLPVRIGPVSITRVSLPDAPVKQGEPVAIRMGCNRAQPDPSVRYQLMFKTGTRTSLHKLSLDHMEESGEIVWTGTIDPTVGAGVFDLILIGRDSVDRQRFLPPEGIHCYRMGYGAWLGKIQVVPSTVPAAVSPGLDWPTRLAALTGADPDRLLQLDESWHLAAGTHIDTPLPEHLPASRIFIVNHLAHVFEEIPFDTRIGTIRTVSDTSDRVTPIIIGRQTAEAMYEFGAKSVRLSHPQSPVAGRLTARLDWPFSLEGIPYDAVYYWAELAWQEGEVLKWMTFQTDSFPGVWSVSAIVIERMP